MISILPCNMFTHMLQSETKIVRDYSRAENINGILKKWYHSGSYEMARIKRFLKVQVIK